jgi:hypothetical protein
MVMLGLCNATPLCLVLGDGQKWKERRPSITGLVKYKQEAGCKDFFSLRIKVAMNR